MSYSKVQPLKQVIYLCHGGRGDNSGLSVENAKPLVDATIWTIPAGTIIDKCYLIIDTLLTGTTDIDVGDDDDSDGFIDGSLSVTVGTVGMYSSGPKLAGVYLKTITAGVTDAADVDTTPKSKYYPATKSLKLDVTTASTAGVARVVVEGLIVGLGT